MKAMKQRNKRASQGDPKTITKAVTHIRLGETNAGKLVALDTLAQVFLELVQQYVTLFCTADSRIGFMPPASRHGSPSAGIAWLFNRQQA
jgi:hypothetical protein